MIEYKVKRFLQKLIFEDFDFILMKHIFIKLLNS